MEYRFDSLYAHGFARVAVCVPHVRVADPAFNAARTLALAQRASEAHAAVALFPELGISAYTNDDLFHQDALLDATERSLEALREASTALTPVLLVGAPLRLEGKLFNCAVALYRGRVLGIVPQDLPAQLPRVLREAPVHFRARRDQQGGAFPRWPGAVRQRPDLRGQHPTRLRYPCRDLRRRLEPDSAEHLRRAG